MKRIYTLFAVCLLMLTAQAQQQFHNPVLAGYHPDPSAIRVGDDYYLVNSSFQYFPGVPVYHSKDLVHWEQIGNVLTRKSQLPLKDATSWLGIYAPTIRYNDGTYYMITTNVGNGGNFLVTAKDPRGPWSEPVWLEQQGIDPSLYFENGKVYMCSNPGDAIWLCEIDPVTGKQLTESRKLWSGDGGRYPEGPHIYKKDGYYYLLISEGGTELAHHLTIARSKDIYGPYESNPDNPILTNCNQKGQSKQIQGTGHGDFVQDRQGNWWVVFLAYRNFSGSYHHLGRETCLAPVSWQEGAWPVIYNKEAIDTVMTTAQLLPAQPVQAEPSEYDFTKLKAFGPEWIHLGQPVENDYTFTRQGLRLTASKATLDTTDPNTFVGLRQTAPKVVYETAVDASALQDGKAGITVFQINDGHIDLYVSREDGWHTCLRMRLKDVDYIIGDLVMSTPKAQLRVSTDSNEYFFEVKDDDTNGQWQPVGKMNCSLLSTEVAGGFTGVTVGLFCNGSGTALFSQLNIKH